MHAPNPGFLLAVDIGGTFTDLTVFDLETGHLKAVKCLTSYDNFVRAIDECMVALGLSIAHAASFKHGTTLVINALLQRKGAHTVLLTTRGFRDVLEIARGNRALPYQMHYRKADPLVSRERRYELTERMSAQGESLSAPDLAELKALASQWQQQGVESIAISFLNAYANPAHEDSVVQALQTLMPQAFITAGSQLSREWYEYERSATASANAFVGPEVGRYVNRLSQGLDERKFVGERYFMGSGSGVIGFEVASEEPVRLVESGPVGGVVGAAAYAKALGLSNMVAFDIGGTTAKCALVKAGQFDIKTSYWVGGYEHGFPIRSSIIDIIEVGAGGGSMARLDVEGRLRVGPESAGSFPGPVAFGRGGTEPTVTDANIVLGRLDPQARMGEDIQLSVDAARSAIWQRLGQPLGYNSEQEVPQIAQGLLTLVSVTMSDAIRKITIERGEDPRDFVLFAYGGGGPLHSVELARELSIPKVIVPMNAGVFSALGMLFAEVESDESRTFLAPLNAANLAQAKTLAEGMLSAIQSRMSASRAQEQWEVLRHAELRYKGQHHTLRIPWHLETRSEELQSLFEASYRQRYGHLTVGASIEFVSVSTIVRHAVQRPDLQAMARQATAAAQATPTHQTRDVFLARSRSWQKVPVFQRADLPIGFAHAGPALIEEYGATCLMDEGDAFHIGPLAEIQIDVRLPRNDSPTGVTP